MEKETVLKYGNIIVDYAKNSYTKCLREPAGSMKYKFIVPGGYYANQLWDWDSWLMDWALSVFVKNEDIEEYEKGCILNFLDFINDDGKMPIKITPDSDRIIPEGENTHKPNLAQHALFIVKKNGNDAGWLEDKLDLIKKYLKYYDKYCKHESGLYFFENDDKIGVDNDPCTFFRPEKSSASIYLNCLMYMEFKAMAELAEIIGNSDFKKEYEEKTLLLKDAIQENCWDERDGFFYSVDINLLPIDENKYLHSGCPRHWNCLIQRIGVWSGFLAMWAGLATDEQAERMVKEHYLNEKTFYAPHGIRTLSKMEKMYAIIKSGNPSCWLGPIWGIANYMVFDGLKKYGYKKEAAELAEKTILLYGRDIENIGEMHEYYHPDTGVGVNKPGFQSWNLLSVNMFLWLKENMDNI